MQPSIPPVRGWRLVLWRHGRTAWNAEHRLQGHLDVGLDDVGRAQARRAAALLAALRPDAIVSSDLGRARETAAALAAVTGLEIRHDEGLRETNLGTLQGRTVDELSPEERAAYDAWRHGGPEQRPPGGENRFEVAARAAAALERAVAALPHGGTLVAVTHGGSAGRAIGSLLGLPAECWSALGGLANCHWSVLSRVAADGPWRLEEHNAGTLPEPVLSDEE